MNYLLRTPYHYFSQSPTFHSRQSLHSYTIFRPYCKSIEEDRKIRLKNKSYSLTENIIFENGCTKYFEQIDIVEAEYILYLRSNFDHSLDEYSRGTWYPYTLIKAMYVHSLPLFVQSSSKELFKNLAAILGVKDRTHLIELIEEKCRNNSFSKIDYFQSNLCDKLKRLLNLEKLGTL